LHNVLGLETLKAGLHNYFAKYKWKNTELSDFIGSLEEAYAKSSSKTMGKDFNLKEWSNQWLLSSGVNTLEPIAVYNPNESIQSLAIQ